MPKAAKTAKARAATVTAERIYIRGSFSTFIVIN